MCPALQKAVTLYKVSDGGDDSVEIEEVGTRPLTQDMLHSEVRPAPGVAPPENGSFSALTAAPRLHDFVGKSDFFSFLMSETSPCLSILLLVLLFLSWFVFLNFDLACALWSVVFGEELLLGCCYDLANLIFTIPLKYTYY